MTAPNAGAGRPSTRLDWWAQTVLGLRSGEAGTMAAPGFGIPTAEIRSRALDAQGLATYYALDGWGAARIVTAPGNVSASVTRDAFGRVTQAVDARGNATSFVWDAGALFLLDSVYDAGAAVGTGYSYDAANYYAVRQVRVNGQERQYVWLNGGRADSVRRAGTGTTRYTYGGRGRPAAGAR